MFPHGFRPRFLHQIPACAHADFPHWWAVTFKMKQALSSPHVLLGSVLSQWKNETRTNRCFWKGKSGPRCLGEVAWDPLQYLSWALAPWEASRAPWGLTGENFPFLASPPFCLCASRAVKPALHLGALLSPLPVTAIFPVRPHSPCRIPACSSQRTGSRRASYLPSVSRLSPYITADIMSTYDLGFFSTSVKTALIP